MLLLNCSRMHQRADKAQWHTARIKSSGARTKINCSASSSSRWNSRAQRAHAPQPEYHHHNMCAALAAHLIKIHWTESNYNCNAERRLYRPRQSWAWAFAPKSFHSKIYCMMLCAKIFYRLYIYILSLTRNLRFDIIENRTTYTELFSPHARLDPYQYFSTFNTQLTFKYYLYIQIICGARTLIFLLKSQQKVIFLIFIKFTWISSALYCPTINFEKQAMPITKLLNFT